MLVWLLQLRNLKLHLSVVLGLHSLSCFAALDTSFSVLPGMGIFPQIRYIHASDGEFSVQIWGILYRIVILKQISWNGDFFFFFFSLRILEQPTWHHWGFLCGLRFKYFDVADRLVGIGSIFVRSSAFCALLATLLQGMPLESSRFRVLLSLSLSLRLLWLRVLLSHAKGGGGGGGLVQLPWYLLFSEFGLSGMWASSLFHIVFDSCMIFMRLLGLPPLRRYGCLQSPSWTLCLHRPGVLCDYCFVILRSLIFSCGFPTMTVWLYTALLAIFFFFGRAAWVAIIVWVD